MLVAYVALWGSYRFRYAPTPGGLTEAQFVMKDQPDSRVASWLQCVDDHRLLPNACVKGFTSMALMAHDRPAFLMGEHSERGWWYYFPVAFLIKTGHPGHLQEHRVPPVTSHTQATREQRRH